LEAFLRAQPVSTSISFIAWLADMEAAASGARQCCDTTYTAADAAGCKKPS
jgi:hypothetical protein